MTLTNLVRAHVDVPQFVEFASGTVTIVARCELTNDAADEVALSAATSEEALFWHVLNDQQREIARRPYSMTGRP